MDAQLNTRRILIFLAIAVGVPWAADLVIYLSGALQDNAPLWATVANYIAISTPALAAIATRLITREGWADLWLRPNFRRGWRFYLAAWLLPLLAVIAGGALFFLLFPQAFDPGLGEVRKLFAVNPAIAEAPWMGLVTLVVQIMLITVFINGIVSIGEEFGWRAYLFPRLMAAFDSGPARGGSAARKAALLVGVFHGVWHFPLFALAAFAGTPPPNLLAYVVFTSAMSVLLCWVTLRSGSVWPASVGHGMVNATSILPPLVAQGSALALLGPSPTGLIAGMGYIVLALVLLFNRKAFSGKEAAGQAVVPAAGQVSP